MSLGTSEALSWAAEALGFGLTFWRAENTARVVKGAASLPLRPRREVAGRPTGVE